jgi:drug/metabolite transporter (DMT)-like permease
MLLGGVGFTGMTVCIKLAGKSLPVWEIVLLRQAFAFVAISPVMLRAGPSLFRTERLGAHVLRCFFGLCGVSTMMLAVTHLELALATTLGFTRTLFMIVLAVLFLGEIVRWRRTAATLVGFAGVVICLRPGAGDFDPWTLVGLVSALFAAGVTTMIKRLTSTEPTLRILAFSYVLIGLMAAVPAAVVWVTPSLTEIGYVVAMALFSAWGQSCMVQGLAAGEVTAVAPFEYARLLFAAAAGFAVFGETPTAWTVLGAAVIISATLYIALREARLARERQRSA